MPVIFQTVEMKIGKYEFETEIAWALTEEVVPLLGRNGVFDKFNVYFKQSRQIVEFHWEGR
uniref:Uncharacterized protein n=1 Tax=candidate division WOR-3 bacterium TaxID=2052148 RepID=A0A7C6AA10_UNCW3